MRPSPEIEAIVRRLLAARETGDVEVMDRLWSRSEHLVSVGSDEHEWWVGGSGSIKVASAHWEEWPTVRVEILRLHAFEAGSVGWAVIEQRRTDPSGRSGIFRQTFVFELEAGAWKIVHNHFSAPVPNIDTAGVELTRTLSDLLDSVDGDGSVEGRESGTSTLVFTDIVGSTELSRSMGPEEWSRWITSHLDSVRDAVEAEGGSVVKTLGDGGMYAFDSGSSALRAAVRLQHLASRDSDPTFELRVGVHTGDVVHTRDDYLGETVAKAARVASAARGGQILVSSTTAGMVPDSEFRFGPPLSVELKGLTGVHQLHPLDWS